MIHGINIVKIPGVETVHTYQKISSINKYLYQQNETTSSYNDALIK